MKLLVDSAPRAQLRYYNLLAEQHEFHNADPARKARQIKGVGQDSAYGGAGAWWTRATRQLVAYDRDKILKLRVNVAGFDDAACPCGRRARWRGAPYASCASAPGTSAAPRPRSRTRAAAA